MKLSQSKEKGQLTFFYLSLLVCCLVSSSIALTSSSSCEASSRRGFLQRGAGLLLTAGTSIIQAPNLALAADDDGLAAAPEKEIEVYFGCGCFWHVQHELVEAERKILGRSDAQLTTRAGYAGGKAGSKDGKVCYHNALSISDYGKLGHAEVVQVSIPPSSFQAFAKEYFELFSEQGYRADQWGDKGLEYRNLIGFPGGVASSYAKELIKVSQDHGDKLDFAKGKGDDPDARALCFVMDTADFPFYVAEQYHQFHDGFNLGENYPNSYNSLASQMSKAGVLGESKCPNGLIGVGALGL